MNIALTEFTHTTLAELTDETVVIRTVQDAVDLLGNCRYQGADGIILHQHQLAPDFFDLKTGLAGEILQKFSNYGMAVAIAGDFSAFDSNSLRDFIYESNKGRQVNFVASREAAFAALAR